MKELNLVMLKEQIKSLFKSNDKEEPKIEFHKFGSHVALVVNKWEFYFDPVGDGCYMLSDITDSEFNEDVEMARLKGSIILEVLNNGVVCV